LPEFPFLNRQALHLRPDPTRVIVRPFKPATEPRDLNPTDKTRANHIVERVLALDPDTADRQLADVLENFLGRHRNLLQTFEARAAEMEDALADHVAFTQVQRQLVGAYFLNEYSFEASALFNPSIVAHPDQSGTPQGSLRFILSLRAVGEGHLSSIEFRTGTISGDCGTGGGCADGGHGAASDCETSDWGISIDPPGPFPDIGRSRAVAYDRSLFQEKLAEVGREDENAQFLWSLLPPRFSMAELDAAVAELSLQQVLRGDSVALVDWVRWMAASSYEVEFDPRHAISERVLWPSGPAESHGMEDARFVRFTGDGDPVYFATYTAFDGRRVESHLLETADFRVFTVSQLAGQSAKNKGMALFPRLIGGRYVALSRWDRESNGITYSDDAHDWSQARTFQSPVQPWELIQLGNCGSPIETPAGWLVFTHGVGPMREYAVSAVLLDLAEPEHLIARLPEPLLVAEDSEREGYVPNVVYSCGAMAHGEVIVLPYGCSDSSVRIATIDLPRLLERLGQG